MIIIMFAIIGYTLIGATIGTVGTYIICKIVDVNLAHVNFAHGYYLNFTKLYVTTGLIIGASAGFGFGTGKFIGNKII